MKKWSFKRQKESCSRQIAELVQAMVDGWNTKNGDLFASPFSEDADYVVINGMYVKGRTTIAQAHHQIFNSIYKHTEVSLGIQSIRTVRADLAIVHLNGTMKGQFEGRLIDSKSIISLVVEQTESGWQILAFQNTFVQPAGQNPNLMNAR